MRKLTRALSMLLVCCMMFTLLPVTALAAPEDGEVGKKGGIYDGEITELEVENYYSATGISKNGNFQVRGIATDAQGRAWCVLASNQEDGDKHGFMSSSIEGEVTVTDPHYKKVAGDKDATAQLKLIYPDKKEETVAAASDSFAGIDLYVIEIGSVVDVMTSFKLFIDSSDSGWDILIENPPVEIKMGYDIKKYVNGEDAGEDVYDETKAIDLELGEAEAARTLTYKVVVTNTGDHPVYHVNVKDVLPANLAVKSVTSQIKAPAGVAQTEPITINPIYNAETREMTLDTDLTLPKGFEKEYIITAVIDEDFEGGYLDNVANIQGGTLLPDSDHAIVNVGSYFYVHHIYNDGNPKDVTGMGKEVRIDKIKVKDVSGSFNVTAPSNVASIITGENGETTTGTYDGLFKDEKGRTLYGGTFNADYVTPYGFTDGENGVGFTPGVNKHYYVWEPTNLYLRPFNISAWHPHGDWKPATASTQYHVIAGYPGSSVDRLNYQEFGFDFDDPEPNMEKKPIYSAIKAQNGFAGNDDHKGNSVRYTELTPINYLGRTGYFGCEKFTENLFGKLAEGAGCGEFTGGAEQTFRPYWITHDGVKVSAVSERTVSYKGVGDGGQTEYKMLNYQDNWATGSATTAKAPSNKTLMLSAMYFDENLEIPGTPAAPNSKSVLTVYETITAGKSGNVKRLALSADLSNFDFDEAWFMINDEIRVDADAEDGMISAEFKLNKVEEGELTIVPCWQNDGEEVVEGGKLVLMVEKKLVEKVTEDENTDANSIGYLTDDEYVEVVVTEEPVETEATEEVTEETEAAEETEAVEEVPEETEAVEESGKKNDKKNNNKKNNKNDKKNNKKDEVAETEPVEETVVTEPVEEATEAPVEVAYEEITTVSFVRCEVVFEEAPFTQNFDAVGFIVQ